MATEDKLPLIPRKPRPGQKFVLVIHGGAGTMSRASATPERQALYRVALKAALDAGYAVLREGGEALDAAVAAVTVLEGGWSLISSRKCSFVTRLLRLSSLQRGEGSSVRCLWEGAT
jgi:hypothetical protein